MKKLTPTQLAALRYYNALRQGVPAKERARLGLRRPDPRPVERLFELGLLTREERIRYSHAVKMEVPEWLVVITEAGVAYLDDDCSNKLEAGA